MKNEKGFTLIELMIVVAIIGIIASLAVTSYNDSVTKSKRADAKATLVDLSAQFERCFTMNGQYTTTAAQTTPIVKPAKTCALVTTSDTLNTTYTTSTKGYYTIALSNLTTNTFTLTATPTGFTDNKCTSFTLTQTGAKTFTTSVTGYSNCW